jgi:shikimate kinase
MQLKLRVTTNEGVTYDVATNLFTIVAMERKFKIRASDLEHGVAMEHMVYMAYEASKQAGVTVSPVFDDFIKTLADVEVIESEPGNPTDPVQSDTP